MRAFISIEISEDIKREILKIQEQLPEFAGKLIEFENLHLTLKFLGDIDKKELKEIRKRLNEIRSKEFETGIDILGFFSEDFIRIIWLHITNCEKLQKLIDEKLGDLFEKERFTPHLTIARVKNIQDKKKFLEEFRKIKMPPLRFKVEKFYLKESILTEEKPIYRDLAVYNLQ